VDRERRTPLAHQSKPSRQEVPDGIVGNLDANIVADYGKGLLTAAGGSYLPERHTRTARS